VLVQGNENITRLREKSRYIFDSQLLFPPRIWLKQPQAKKNAAGAAFSDSLAENIRKEGD